MKQSAEPRIKMAEHGPTGGIKIPSSGNNTPEYISVLKSYEELNSAIAAIRDEFVSRSYSCGLIPSRLSRNKEEDALNVVLDEVFRDPINYYCLQYVVDYLNVGRRFKRGIEQMEKTFRGKRDK